MTKNDDKYTDPELRAEIKEKIQEGSKGGQPGQWSARKAQMMASEYKKEMHARDEEPYTTDKSEQSESQKHLSKWTEEDWQTSDGNATAKQADGTERRYLPKEAWNNMSEEEKQETDAKKVEGSKEGKQYVPNTEAAKGARKSAQDGGEGDTGRDDDIELADNDGRDKDRAANGEQPPPTRGTKKKRSEDKEDENEESRSDEVEGADRTTEDVDDEDEPAAKAAKTNEGKKRTTRSSARGEKDAANEHEEKDQHDEHGQPGSKDRLPGEGQSVHWKAGGWVPGTVVTILTSETEYEGLHAKASENDPRIAVKSSKSGKNAVHKPEAVYW